MCFLHPVNHDGYVTAFKTQAVKYFNDNKIFFFKWSAETVIVKWKSLSYDLNNVDGG